MDIFGEEPPVYIAGFILTVISFIIHLIGFASPFWTYISKPDFMLYYELWQYCFSEDEQTTCESLSCDDGIDNPWCTSAWKATQVLEILGLLSLFSSVLLVSLFRNRRILKLAGICCCFIGGVFILIGVIVYGTQEDIDQHSSFHFAFTICILSALGSVIAAILLIIGHRLDDGIDIPWCTTAWKATQVLEILWLLSLFASILLVSLFRNRRILKLAGICCCFIGGVFILIGVIVYGTQEDIDQHSSFHFAFTICIVSTLGSVIAAILLIIGHRLAGKAEPERMDTDSRNDESAGKAEPERMDTDSRNDESAGKAEPERMDTDSRNDESAGKAEPERMDTDSRNDESDDEDQIDTGERKSVAEELKKHIEKEGLNAMLNNLNEHLDNWRNEPVKLALIGKSGVGKSSFINAIRNLKSGDHGFATVSCSGNTTKHATVYKYPGNKNITLHDLPGIGTAEFPKNEYEVKMGLHKYDYFLLFVSNIEENDTELAKKIIKIGKPFCFVRSKLDIDLENAKIDGESEAKAIHGIMSKSFFILEHTGLEEARYFVISNRNRRIGHFNELVSYIQSSLPELKCNAVMFSLLGELTDGIIDSKYELLKKRRMSVSMASAGVAAIPVPGVDVVLNLALICREILLYHKAFGFGQQIVIDISKDKYLRKKLSASSIIEIKAANEAMRTFVIIQMGKLGAIMAVQSAFDFIFPIIGSVVSGLTAGTVTYRLLTRILKGCRDDAKLVYSHLLIVNAEKERKKGT